MNAVKCTLYNLLFFSIFFPFRHWLTSSYILFAVPYFVYDIYAMFLCYWYKTQIKGHEEQDVPKPISTALSSYLRREFLMVLHHVVMVAVCFPVSVVSSFVQFNANDSLKIVLFNLPFQHQYNILA